MNRLFWSFVAGLFATLPMTVWMLSMNKLLPAHHQDPLPPEEITTNLAKEAGIEPELSKGQKQGLSLVNHFLYGGLIATPFGLFMTRQNSTRKAVRKGFLYGLFVWFTNYMGFLPTVNLYPPAEEEPTRMNSLMVAAHLIWGGSLGWLLSRRGYSAKS